jgi:Ni,Fe-hydrogenase maturation factor
VLNCGPSGPQEVTVYLIEAENPELGLNLSPVVEKSGDRVFQALVELMSQWDEKGDRVTT